MTRSDSGRSPRSADERRRAARRADRSTADRTDGTGPAGSRVTARPDPSQHPDRSRRRRVVQVAAVAFVVLLLAAMMVGCARYDGDQAAFCAGLAEAPSFTKLSVQTASGSSAQAEATMNAAAEQFRALERSAPRKIRATVATLGDSAERIASHLAPGASTTRNRTIYLGDGQVITIPETQSESQLRLSAFSDELLHHHGTIAAVNDLMTYAREDCGITDRTIDLGLIGFGGIDPSAPSVFGDPGSGFGPGVPSPTPTMPPMTAAPVPPGSTPAPRSPSQESPPPADFEGGSPGQVPTTLAGQ